MQLLQEHELVVDPEPDSDDDEDTLASMLQQQRLHGSSEGAPLDDDMSADMAAVEAQTSPDQLHFARFAARMARAPNQVLQGPAACAASCSGQQARQLGLRAGAALLL